MTSKVFLYSFLLAVLSLLGSIIVGIVLYLFESIWVVLSVLTVLYLVPVYVVECFLCISIDQE